MNHSLLSLSESWFAVHAVSMNYTNRMVSSDNMGYASYLMEQDKNPGELPRKVKPRHQHTTNERYLRYHKEVNNNNNNNDKYCVCLCNIREASLLDSPPVTLVMLVQTQKDLIVRTVDCPVIT